MNNMKNQTTRLLEEENCVELSEQDLDAVVGGISTGPWTGPSVNPGTTYTGTNTGQPAHPDSAFDPNPIVTPVIPPGLCVSK